MWKTRTADFLNFIAKCTNNFRKIMYKSYFINFHVSTLKKYTDENGEEIWHYGLWPNTSIYVSDLFHNDF